jgi:C-methyltransferase
MDMLYRRSEESAAETARLLLPWVPSGRALDLGGGHGRYGHELARNGIAVTLFDRTLCCEIAQERYGDAIETREGDFMVDDLGGPYHLILLSNIVHGLGPEEIETLMPRLRSALVPGGVIAIKDMFLDDSMSQSEAATFFGLTMLLYTSSGRSHTVSEMRDALQRAGFDELDAVEVRDQQFSVLIAR